MINVVCICSSVHSDLVHVSLCLVQDVVHGVVQGGVDRGLDLKRKKEFKLHANKIIILTLKPDKSYYNLLRHKCSCYTVMYCLYGHQTVLNII
jgi:hypothetical protein